MGAGGYECLTGGVVLEFLEIVDEHVGELVGLLVPFGRVGVGVARVEDLRIYAGEFGGNDEVEDRQGLCRDLEDGAVEDVVDDAAGVADRDALACSVPAGVCLLYTSPSPRDA